MSKDNWLDTVLDKTKVYFEEQKKIAEENRNLMNKVWHFLTAVVILQVVALILDLDLTVFLTTVFFWVAFIYHSVFLRPKVDRAFGKIEGLNDVLEMMNESINEQADVPTPVSESRSTT